MTLTPAFRRTLLDMFALSLGGVVALGFARFAYALLLPPMQAELGWSFALSGGMNAANALGYLLGALASPALLARLGLRAAFVWGLILTALSLLACAAVSDTGILLALRLLSGMSGAAVLVAGGNLAALAVRGHGRGTALLGVFYSGSGSGILLSALLLPPLISPPLDSWRLGWVALGLAALLALVVVMPTLTRLSGGLPAPAPAGGPGAPLRPLGWAFAAYTCFGVGYIAYMTFIVAFLRQAGAGALVTPFWALLGLCVVLNPLLWPRLEPRLGPARVMALQLLTLAIGAALPLFGVGPGALLLSGVLFGLSFVAVVASTTVLARRVLPEPAWARAIAAFTVIFALGQVLGPVLTGVVADGPGGLRAGLGLSAAVLLLGAVLAGRQRAAELH